MYCGSPTTASPLSTSWNTNLTLKSPYTSLAKTLNELTINIANVRHATRIFLILFFITFFPSFLNFEYKSLSYVPPFYSNFRRNYFPACKKSFYYFKSHPTRRDNYFRQMTSDFDFISERLYRQYLLLCLLSSFHIAAYSYTVSIRLSF